MRPGGSPGPCFPSGFNGAVITSYSIHYTKLYEAAIHKDLIALAEGGAAVLVVSQDLDELFAICDRIAVMSHGRLSPAQPVRSTSVEEIGMLMGGVFHLEGEAAHGA